MSRRFCCDGLCAQGRHCPAFAPGVLEAETRSQQPASRLRRLAFWLLSSGVLMLFAALIGFAAGVLS